MTPKGAVSHEPVVTMDLHATLLEAAGARGETVDGTSLTRLLRDPGAKLNREAIYFHYPHYYATTSPVSAVRAGNWKLIEFLEDDRTELYNLADDPREQRDVAAVHPDKARELKTKLAAWRRSVNAQMPAKGPAQTGSGTRPGSEDIRFS